jgi:hypothetical protein
MTKVAHLLLFLLLTTCSTSLWAEKELPPEIQRMTDEAFQFYSSRQTEEYFAAVKAVKAATVNTEYEETYYRACSYMCIKVMAEDN